MLLTNKQVLKICKAFTNGLLANTKFSKAHLSKIVQSGGLLSTLYLPSPIDSMVIINKKCTYNIS